jgi:histidyl-tRNA synthetase
MTSFAGGDPFDGRRPVAGKFQSLRGFRDLLPGETEHWQRFEAQARELLRRYGYREVRVPHLEATELFARSVGEATDIVGKEMFTFDAGDESVSLRPEMTAQVCRAYIQHGLDRKGINRLYYLGPAFRKERPQRGRLRQFHQLGLEVFGEPAPETDVEAVAVAWELTGALGIDRKRLIVGSLGDAETRPAYREALQEFLQGVSGRLCQDCVARIRTNPMRVLDCKREECRAATEGAPDILEHLSDEASRHFDAVLEGLGRLGIEPEIDPRLVRGLDYYVRTTFEIRAAGLGAQDAVLGGGRYDGLVKALGGADVPGLGWAAGIERLMIAAGLDEAVAPPQLDVYLVTLGEGARAGALERVQALRGEGLAVAWDTSGHGLGGQMKRAGRSGARYAVLVGDDELEQGRATIKDLASGEQLEGPLESAELARWVRSAGGADATAPGESEA